MRGGSHSGNIAATDLARHGWLDVLSSDYIPGALVHAAFLLPELVEEVSLDAIRMVTLRPATAAHLHDRGEIAVGKRADWCGSKRRDDMPTVRAVWRQGHRVS